MTESLTPDSAEQVAEVLAWAVGEEVPLEDREDTFVGFTASDIAAEAGEDYADEGDNGVNEELPGAADDDDMTMTTVTTT